MALSAHGMKGSLVAYNFQPVDRNQRFLLPVDMADWLSRDHFVYFVIELVEQLDLSAFRSAYRPDGKGGAAYDPAAMVTLLAYAYCDGERSSRRIAEHCRTDIAYRLVMGGLLPDHSTISRFRDRHEKALADIFVPILHVCLEAGMGDVSLAAVDGSKFRCPASLRANRKLAGIERELASITEEIEVELTRIAGEILAASRRADLDDDTLFGPPPPREPGTLPEVVGLPKKLHGKAARRARLAKAKELLDNEHRAQCTGYDERMAGRAATETATGKKIRGRKPAAPQRDPDQKINVTDPDSRIMKDAHGGYLQGYNAQNVVAKDRCNLAPQVVNDEDDSAQLHPMMDRTRENLARAESASTVDLYLADSGYCTEASLAGIDPDGSKVLLATGKEHKTRAEARQLPVNDGTPPEGLSRKEKMAWERNTAAGKAAYAQRAATVEPGFAQHKHNRGMFFFLRAGLPAVDSEWKLINATDNIEKLYRRMLTGKATAGWSTVGRLICLSPAT